MSIGGCVCGSTNCKRYNVCKRAICEEENKWYYTVNWSDYGSVNYTDNSVKEELTPDKKYVEGINLVIEFYKVGASGSVSSAGKLDTSTVGKYLIKYIASDNYGNSKTEERMLTIKHYQ